MTECTYIVGDTRDVVAGLPDGSVDLVMTSPPFLQLRSYLPDDHPNKDAEVGSERTPAEFLSTLLELTAEWRRVLAPHGTLAVELGDTYSGSGGSGGDYAADGMRAGQIEWGGSAKAARSGEPSINLERDRYAGSDTRDGWPLAKSLALIPEMYRLALAYGRHPLNGQPSPAGQWRVRNNVTWARSNPPVGALSDKWRPSTSDLVVACTAKDRWFDMEAVRGGAENVKDQRTRTTNGPKRNASDPTEVMTANYRQRIPSHPGGAPPLDHWIIPPGGYSGAHFAVFPVELCRIPIESCCPRRVCRTCGAPSRRLVDSNRVGEADDSTRTKTDGPLTHSQDRPPEVGWEYERTTIGWTTCGCPGTDGIRLDGFHTGGGWRPGIVLDPFGGSGTVGVSATGRGRDAILIDIDERNLDLARERVGMWLVDGTPTETTA